ncbi:MAG: amidase family protein, partial [bacterium]
MSALWQLGAAEIVSGITSKTISAVEVTEQTLERLDQVNPKINAVVQEMPDQALAAAKQIDAAIARGDSPGTLAGVPVTIKVNVDQKGHATTNGLVTLKDNIAEHDSPLVTNLRNAGAIIIGRTNTPAFSLRWFTRNQLHGHTLNPRNKTLTPGGSSGGAAAAVAAGIGAIGHGTDIAGSIRYPAYACGLHGIRPTLGRVPAVNLSLPDRHIGPQITAVSGPMARTVEDVRLGYEAMSQSSHLDPWYVPAPRDSGDFKKVAALCTHPDGLETIPEIVAALKTAAKQLEDAGWNIVETECPPLREPMDLQIRLWTSEFHLDQGAAFKKENDPDANFIYAQLLDLTEQPTLHSVMEIMKKRVSLIRKWELFLGKYPILLCPVSAGLPFEDQLDVRSAKDFREILDAQMTQVGLPLLSMPAMTVTTGNISETP